MMHETPQESTTAHQVGQPPKVGEFAPSLGKDIQIPSGKPMLVVFLRHCGDPFAVKIFKSLTSISNHHPEVRCVAVSQCSQADTDDWIVHAGGEWEVEIVIDEPRALYAEWGLRENSTWSAMNPLALWRAYKLGTEEGMWNREFKTGSKWQMGGAFGIDANGYVRWSKPAATPDEVPDLKEGLKALGVSAA
ncbi:hypothetical protein VTK26DRAFT_2718 [Humicola hyalothermophila]